MGANQSYLSSADYGYDYVLAVTQDSINAAALAFLNSRQPVVSVCYVYDDSGDPVELGYAELRAKAKGSDPFHLPAAGPDRDAAIGNLDDAGFMFGFQAAMGLPEGFRLDLLPPMVTFGATGTDPVLYRLLCRTFQLVELKPVPHKTPVLQTFAQPTGPSGQPWVFSYQVPLVHQQVADNAAFAKSAAFENMPTQVRANVSGHPEDFTIRQLIFEFDQAAAAVRPEIEGVDRVLRERLYEDFSIKYFDQMRGSAPPVIVVTRTGGDPLAGLQTQFSINPVPSTPKLATLNYLCTDAGQPLPGPKTFPWNWVEANEADAFDGVCVLNRDEFAARLRSQVGDYVDRNKWVPIPWIKYNIAQWKAWLFVVPPDDKRAGRPDIDTLTTPETGEVLLDGHFAAFRKAADGWTKEAWVTGSTDFRITVTCRGNQLAVEQHAAVGCEILVPVTYHGTLNLVDLKLTDTYTLSASHDGQLTAERTSTTQDNAPTIPDLPVPDLKEYLQGMQQSVKGRIGSAFADLPLAILDNVVFPGGRSFLFKAVTFSDHQDLIAHITYAEPS
ncbi:MAG TPA: hypothetical protein VFP34_12430 [Microlunatus sp.]|nr:hypothetical protein [Microlunatus sp.]